MNNKELARLISVISFVSVIIALIIIIFTGSANSYEISIYNVYPSYFWLLLIIPFISPFTLLCLRESDTNLRIYVILTIISATLSFILLLLLPFFRGYELYGAGDTHTHLRYISTIILTGHTGSNIYPVLHIFVSSISLITSLSPRLFSFFINPVFMIIFILGVYLLSSELFNDTKKSLTVTALSVIPILGFEITRESIMPSVASFLLMPLVLFLFLKSNQSSNSLSVPFSILLVILVFLFPFFHPETTIFLLIILTTIFLTTKFLQKYKQFRFKNHLKVPYGSLKDYSYSVIILLAVSFFVWFSSTVEFGYALNQIVNSLISNVLQGPLVTRTNFFFFKSNLDKIIFIVKMYGPVLIFLIIAGILSLFTIFSAFFLKRKTRTSIILISILFFVLSGCTLIFLLKGLIISFSVFRLVKYPFIISIMFVGSYLLLKIQNQSLLSKKNIHKLITIFVIIIIFPTSFAVFSTYNSPNINGFSYQNTKEDFNGMYFLFDHRNQGNLIMEGTTQSFQTRFLDTYSVGLNSTEIGPNIRSGYNENILPIPHFGDNGVYLGNYYAKDSYLILNELAELYYPTLYPKYENFWRYSPEDYKKLNQDPTVNYIYNNGGFNILYVNS